MLLKAVSHALLISNFENATISWSLAFYTRQLKLSSHPKSLSIFMLFRTSPSKFFLVSASLSFSFLRTFIFQKKYQLILKASAANRIADKRAKPKQYHSTTRVPTNWSGRLQICERMLNKSSARFASADIIPRIQPSANSLLVAFEIDVSFLQISARTRFLAF